MKKKLFALMLVAGASAFAQDQFSGGFGAGQPDYGPPPGAYAQPPVCGPGAVWIDGYNDSNGYWVDGYCTVPPYSDSYWVAPGYFGGRFVAGYWGRGYGHAPGFGFGGGYAFRGGREIAPRFEGEHSNGFRSPGPTSGFRPQGGGDNHFRAQAAPSNSFRPQGNPRNGGPAARGGAAGHGGSEHGGRR